MKNKIYLIILLSMLLSCGVQKKYHIPKISPDFEKYDSLAYAGFEKKWPYGKYTKDSTLIKVYNKQYTIIENKSRLELLKRYYKNGNIKEKGYFYVSRIPYFTFYVGTWYEYDEQGNLIKTTNYEDCCKVTFSQALAYTSKYIEEEEKINSGILIHLKGDYLSEEYVSIKRSYSEKEAVYYWRVEIGQPFRDRFYQVLEINMETGDVKRAYNPKKRDTLTLYDNIFKNKQKNKDNRLN